MSTTDYLKNAPTMLKNLSAEAIPNFGLMTPQHMVEHLIWVTKSSIKDMGPPPPMEDIPEGAQKFMHFINSGKPMQYRPSNKTKADLPELRMSSLNDAISELENAVDRVINDYNSRGDKPYYNAMMGVIAPDMMLSFHMRHYQHHLEAQFGLKAHAV